MRSSSEGSSPLRAALRQRMTLGGGATTSGGAAPHSSSCCCQGHHSALQLASPSAQTRAAHPHAAQRLIRCAQGEVKWALLNIVLRGKGLHALLCIAFHLVPGFLRLALCLAAFFHGLFPPFTPFGAAAECAQCGAYNSAADKTNEIAFHFSRIPFQCC